MGTRREASSGKWQWMNVCRQHIWHGTPADGYVSLMGFRDVRDAQNTAERHIQSETHDGQKSWWR